MKVTYLFGAGASANSIPVVNQIKDQLLEFGQKVRGIKKSVEDHDWNDYRLKLLKQIDWLANETENHLSIDTFAKKLYLRKDNDKLRMLKLITSIFFTYLQKTRLVDKRYDGFFASILRDVNLLPRNISIISWNYDIQFELSYREFNKNKSIADVQRILAINSKNRDGYSISDSFSITKLNGSSTFIKDSEISHLFPEDETEIIDHLISIFREVERDKKWKPTLSFAWEPEYINEPYENILLRASNANKDSEVLVIIGYSFPYFNREIDSFILQKMNNLKKVYFQSYEPQNIKARFSTIRDNFDAKDLVEWPDTNQFLIPNELSL